MACFFSRGAAGGAGKLNGRAELEPLDGWNNGETYEREL